MMNEEEGRKAMDGLGRVRWKLVGRVGLILGIVCVVADYWLCEELNKRERAALDSAVAILMKGSRELRGPDGKGVPGRTVEDVRAAHARTMESSEAVMEAHRVDGFWMWGGTAHVVLCWAVGISFGVFVIAESVELSRRLKKGEPLDPYGSL